MVVRGLAVEYASEDTVAEAGEWDVRRRANLDRREPWRGSASSAKRLGSRACALVYVDVVLTETKCLRVSESALKQMIPIELGTGYRAFMSGSCSSADDPIDGR